MPSDAFEAIYGAFETHIRIFISELALEFVGPFCLSHCWYYLSFAEKSGAKPNAIALVALALAQLCNTQW